jgi:hypothetical protein
LCLCLMSPVSSYDGVTPQGNPLKVRLGDVPIEGILDILSGVFKPLVEQWKRTNTAIERSQQALEDMSRYTAESVKTKVMLLSGGIGVCLGIMVTWFAFTVQAHNKVTQHEKALRDSVSFD